MAWAEPQYPRELVNRALKTLNSPQASEAEVADALAKVNNWRSSHSFPLNTFQVGLRRQALRVDPASDVAQRIKRMSSIAAKLERFPDMKLTQMQDLGGCRAIVENLAAVQLLVSIYEESKHKHKLNHKDDYIDSPQASGYRGVHLVYKYFSDRNETYNGLKIEVQIRSKLQHAWATAVETVGTFIRQALKSSQGQGEWLRFFALMGSAIAVIEQTALVPGTPEDRSELFEEIRELAQRLDVANRLHAYGDALRTITTVLPGAHYYLLVLDPVSNEVRITSYRQSDQQKATDAYLDVERSIHEGSAADAVLVSVESLDALRRAYPNYFLDTHVFIDTLKEVLTPNADLFY